jgi:Protein of unknown function (DUF1592)/Protein of unknown function (DUF1588)/Protein of unknown function (DUF1585)/Protein of unknown function (DUF1587)/Protein of unknown function (DUF1595)
VISHVKLLKLLKLSCLTGLLVFGTQFPRAFADELSGAAQFHRDIQPILTEYCSDCHADGAKKGGVAFDEFKSDSDILENHDLWLNALNYMRSGLMPPGTNSRPTQAEQQMIASWIKTSVFKFDPQNPDPGRVTLRRLNRIEYRNSIRDLMGVDYNTDIEFPADDTGYGFDDIGDVLTVSTMLLEKYVEAAKDIVAQAVPTDSKVIAENVIAGNRFRAGGATNTNAGAGFQRRAQGQGQGQGNTILSLPYDKPAAVGTTFNAAHDGSYQMDLEMAVKGAFDYDPRKCRVVFKLDDQELVNKDFAWYDNKTFPFQFDKKLSAGMHRLTCELQPLNAITEGTNTLSMRIVSVTVRGPMDKQYWTRPKNFDRFFTKDAPTRSADRRKYAVELLRNFATKAYRRPVDDKTVDRLTALAETIYTQPGKTFEAGIAHAMEAVIASPRFLFLMEESAQGASPTAAWSQIDEYSLASRLSYFLWATMPDDELTRLATHGELRKNLDVQVKRMLADPRSESLVENFTGQWLQTRDLGGISIDARAILARDNGTEKQLHDQQAAFAARQASQFAQAALATAAKTGTNSTQTNALAQARPQRQANQFALNTNPPKSLDQATRDAMKHETEMFFASVMHEDRSIDELIECNYTFLNEKLATFYGLTNLQVTGTDMRRVTLPPDSFRGGVITEGTVLAITSNPDRTSPVKRGVFVLNNILGTPPPPPPPNVPALEAAELSATNQEPTLRTVLEMHRNTPLCASCHARFDPIGLSLENFNAMGMWRDKERNQPIETAGTLITGESFNDVRELKHILVTTHREDFYRCLTSKLLTYALGRGLEYYDVGTVDQIVQRLDENEGHFSALLTGIIESAPFQEQRNHANATFADSVEPAAKSDTAQIAKSQPAP